MLQQLDHVRCHPLLHAGGHMAWHIVPLEPPLMLGHGRALCLKMIQELAQGLDGVGGADGSTLGDNMV